MYRLGFPGWKIAARLGVPIFFKIEVIFDSEANVYVATSPDLRGLVVESKTKESLIDDVFDCAGMLFSAQLKREPKKKPIAAWSGDFKIA